jgi:hypothetical protein
MERIDFYYSNGIKYEYERSGTSMYLYTNGIVYFSTTLESREDYIKKRLPSDELYFISKVKRHIEGNNLMSSISANYSDRERIRFFDFNRNIAEGEVFDGAYSVDICKAYWVSAFKDGWIDEELFTAGFGVDKRIRLASLGSFAKRKDIYKFDGKRERLKCSIEPKYPHVFFNQANNIYKVMDACKRHLGRDFLFYWTDGVYVANKRSAGVCEEILRDYGYLSETMRLISVHREETSFVTTEPNGRKKNKKKEYRLGFVR